MNSKKIFKLVIIIVISSITLYFFVELFSFVRGVNNDRIRILSAKKAYLVHTSFEGKIIDKEVCDKCSNLRWGVTIQIDMIKEFSLSTLTDRAYQPYYEFERDSILYLKVPNNIYDKVKIGDLFTKDSASTFIRINNIKSFQLLSKDSKEWFYGK